jgi:hypothetical protein
MTNICCKSNTSGKICYAWDNAPFAWLDTDFTWAEGCVIDKLLSIGGAIPLYKIRERLDALPEKDKETLIGLFVRLNVDEIEFETKESKNKNRKVKIKLKDVEVSLKEQRNVKVNIFIS